MKKLYFIIISFYLVNILFAQNNFSSDYQNHLAILNNHGTSTAQNYNVMNFNADFWAPVDLLSQMWEDNDWMNMAYTQFYYDTNGLLTNDLNQGWTGDAWIDNSRTTYTYENNLQTMMETENWENETWVPYIRAQWTYNENGRVTHVLNQNWTNNEWVNTSQSTYTYDGDNCTELLMENWNAGAWETQHKTTYEYDGEGNNIVSISETYMFGFLITSKELNTFSQGLRITSLRQNLAGTEWIDASRSTYTYNGNGQQTQFVSENWTGIEWQYTMQGLYTYDENGNNTEVLTQNWQDNAWVNFMKLTYNYQQMTDVENNKITVKDFQLLNNYPNPFNPSTVICYQLPAESYVTLKVYNLLGGEVATLVDGEKSAGNYQVEFNSEGLPSGTYIYRLESNGKTLSQKMTLLK